MEVAASTGPGAAPLKGAHARSHALFLAAGTLGLAGVALCLSGIGAGAGVVALGAALLSLLAGAVARLMPVSMHHVAAASGVSRHRVTRGAPTRRHVPRIAH